MLRGQIAKGKLNCVKCAPDLVEIFICRTILSAFVALTIYTNAAIS